MFGFQTIEMIMKGNLGGEMSLNCLLLPVAGANYNDRSEMEDREVNREVRCVSGSKAALETLD